VFVVGYDTAVRLVKPDYYGSDQAMLLQVGSGAEEWISVCVWWGKWLGLWGAAASLRQQQVTQAAAKPQPAATEAGGNDRLCLPLGLASAPQPCVPCLAPQFAKLRHLGCSFLVAGRVDSEGRFKTLADLEMPAVLPRGVRLCATLAGVLAWLAVTAPCLIAGRCYLILCCAWLLQKQC
jgi:hypothetical protein